MNVGIIVFPGSNCDRDAEMVVRDILKWPVRMVWHQDENVSDLDLIIVPGGFSYGDYLRCGAIARFSPAMSATVRHAQQGKAVLGICNGFQVLTEVGLLPGPWCATATCTLFAIAFSCGLSVPICPGLKPTLREKWLRFPLPTGRAVIMLTLTCSAKSKPITKSYFATAIAPE